MTTVIFSILALGALALAFGALLGYTSIKFKVEQDPIVDQIDAILPQTQCGQCGFAGCRPYAEAIANGEAINRCPPGGEGTVQKLADLLGREPNQWMEPMASKLKRPPLSEKQSASVVLSALKFAPWMPF